MWIFWNSAVSARRLEVRVFNQDVGERGHEEVWEIRVKTPRMHLMPNAKLLKPSRETDLVF